MTLTEATYIPPVETGQLISGHSKHVFIHDDSTEKLGKRIANSFLKQESTLKTWKKHKLHPQVSYKTHALVICYFKNIFSNC